MFLYKRKNLVLWYFVILCIPFTGQANITANTQDQTSPRYNTLLDDADDIQRQLDNEARDRVNYGQPKTIWVINFPSPFPVLTTTKYRLKRRESLRARARRRRDVFEFQVTSPIEPAVKELAEETPGKDWDYAQQFIWHKTFEACGAHSQSPVNVPVEGLLKVTGARTLIFRDYNTKPINMTLHNDGKRVVLSGVWKKDRQPMVYGGPAHSRRYLFHSLIIHTPSEHSIGSLPYPMETQALHLSADYGSFEDAVKASAQDPQAFLGIANIYKMSTKTHPGLAKLVAAGGKCPVEGKVSVEPTPLAMFNPPFCSCATYQGSLPFPPCTESVLWMVRAIALPVSRGVAKYVHTFLDKGTPPGKPKRMFIRFPQPLNDRPVFWFTSK